MCKAKCPVCGKEVESRGMGGHLYGVHGIKVGPKQEMAGLIGRLSKIEIKLAKIKNIAERPLQDNVIDYSCESKLKEIARIATSILYPDAVNTGTHETAISKS